MAKLILCIVLAITAVMNANNRYETVEPADPLCVEGIHIGEDVCLLCGETINKWNNAIESENFSVDKNMMTYFMATSIEPYSTYFSHMDVDPSKSLKTQMYDENTSWFDYFAEYTKAYVGDLLVLCEYATDNGIEASADDFAYVDSYMSSIAQVAKKHGYTTDVYLETVFGHGVTESVVRRCLQLERLAADAYNHFFESAEYTAEELVAYRDANPDLFITVDYIECTFAPSAFTKYNAEGLKITTPDEDILAAKNAARELSKLTNIKDFVSYAESYILQTDAPNAHASFIEKINCCTLDDLSDKVSGWARYEDVGSTIIESSSDYDAWFNVYMLLRTPSVDETPVRNIRHILLTYDSYTEEEAYKIYEKWENSDFSEKKFDELSLKYNEDYNADGVCNDISHGDYFYGLDEWIFDKDRRSGDRDIIETSYGWHIVEYIGEGELKTWEIYAIDYMAHDAYEALIEEGKKSISCYDGLIASLNF